MKITDFFPTSNGMITDPDRMPAPIIGLSFLIDIIIMPITVLGIIIRRWLE